MPATASPLTVAELVQSPALQLSVVAGGAGLDRRVSWAHVSELEDPTPWLMGHELIMTTGIGVPRPAAQQRAYLERLDAASVSALALSDQLHVPPLTAAFHATANSLGLPVLRVPLPVPFIAIAQEVAAAVQSDMHRRLTAQLHVFGALRTLAAEDLSTGELFRRLEHLSGYQLFACTPSGRPLLPGVPAPPPPLVAALPSSFDSAPALPNGYVLPVPAPGGPAGFLLAVERAGAAAAGLAVVQHIATVAALQVSIRRSEHEALRREGAETLAELLQGVLDTATARRRLTRAGFDADGRLTVAVARTVNGEGPVDDNRLLRALDALDVPALVLRQQHDLFLLLPAGVDLGPVLGEGRRVAIGLSRPFRAGDPLTLGRREALWAAARAVDAGGGLVLFGRDAAGRWLAEDPQALAALVETVLGSVIGYDEQHGAQLLSSVRSWLQHDRRTRETAEALHIHPNTLAYRVRRFEELTGRSLTVTADLAEVWLALHAVAHTQTREGLS